MKEPRAGATESAVPPTRGRFAVGPIRLDGGQLTDLVAVVVLIVAGVVLMVAERRSGVILLGSAAYVAFAGSTVIAAWLVRNPVRRLWRRFGAWVDASIDSFGLWILLVCALATPGFLASPAGRINTIGEASGGTFLMTFTGMLVGLLQLTPRHRDRAFRRLRHLGWLTPVLYSGCFFVCTLAFFTELTLLLDVRFEGIRDVTSLRAGQVASFYIWHFAALLPLADVPETLRWSEPLRYRGSDVGTLVVIFLVFTTTTIFAAFRAYWKFRREPVPDEPVGG
jgi:hypothetical protein